LNEAPPSAAASCGGTERWNVKDANDADAASVDQTPVDSTVAALNQEKPAQIDKGGRMPIEKKVFTIQGYIAFFKHEGDDDYHVVITDDQGGYSNGHSIVVELPDPKCFSGHSGLGPHTSVLAAGIGDARSEFEDKMANIDGTDIPAKSIPVTVTGVAFFDFFHNQTGHSVIQKLGTQSKVIELHPVIGIDFTNAPETD
jgi:hypothetical protein